MRIEDEHLDVLQNIEVLVTSTYREHPEMTDFTATRTYEALLDFFAAERVGRQPRDWNPSPLEREVFASILGICTWRLGRQPLRTEDSDAPVEQPPETIDVETLVRCLKRLRNSVRTWSKHGGPRGYLDFIVQHVV